MSDLRSQILNVDDSQVEQVTVPEWGGVTLEIRGLSGKQRAGYFEAAFDLTTGTANFERLYPDLIIASAHDPETGERVFEATDRDVLNTKSAAALERVGKVAARLSGLDKDAVSRGKDG